MASESIFRTLRGVVGNALVWGAGWFAATLVVLATLRVIGADSESGSWVPELQFAARSGIMGAIAGTAFATFIRLWYRGRRLSDLNWVRFGLGGALVIGLFVPAFLVVARLLSGDDFLPLSALLRNGFVGAVFGGAAAGVSLKLAQLADRYLPDRSHDQPDLLESGDLLASAGTQEARSRAPARPGTGN